MVPPDPQVYAAPNSGVSAPDRQASDVLLLLLPMLPTMVVAEEASVATVVDVVGFSIVKDLALQIRRLVVSARYICFRLKYLELR